VIGEESAAGIFGTACRAVSDVGPQWVPVLVVPGERFELPTNGLQNRCSTTELTRQINGLLGAHRPNATALLPFPFGRSLL
jgi:hypothetical protein